ncbi:MAG: FecR domain-containing protein, partial [Chitinophagaceae bacterium]|nr:FecR domain-containing protein [Chitinophagaceae bacterium]
MNKPNNQVRELFHQWMTGQLDASRQQEVADLLANMETRDEALAMLKEEWESMREVLPVSAEQRQKIYDIVFDKGPVQAEITTINKPKSSEATIYKILRWSSAAAILIAITTVLYLWLVPFDKKQIVADITKVPSVSDVQPGTSRATLTLSDGKTVELNNNISETIKDGSISIKNREGKLFYGEGNTIVSNTMSTPRGGEYQLVLSDGTRVWLNASSSITYPSVFTGKTREVTVYGEVYFEISANKKVPFIVKTSKETITVLGTSFNINDYSDETIRKISLVEGSIKINSYFIDHNPG